METIRRDLEKIVEQNWPNCQSEAVLSASRRMDQEICSFYMKAKDVEEKQTLKQLVV